jgi:hypothetical protein
VIDTATFKDSKFHGLVELYKVGYTIPILPIPTLNP